MTGHFFSRAFRYVWRRVRPALPDRPKPVLGLGTPPPEGHLKADGPPKRALVSYITEPFTLAPGDWRNNLFSNIGIGRGIVRALNELGYVVDLVQYSDTQFVPQKPYDLFLGHGGTNFERLDRALPKDVVRIYFSTGIYWKEGHTRNEQRFEDLEKRRGVRLPRERQVTADEEYANRAADGIICLGSHLAKESYRGFPLVINLNNAAYFDDHCERPGKDFAAAREKFLFFSGPGNVHKGLDLLLEAFSRLDAALYVCQEIEREFRKVYRRELETLPNIRCIGQVPLKGDRFYRLVDECAFVIHPTCAEGQPGSLIECMWQGLIPVASRQVNMDMDDFGITLKDCSVDEIVAVVTDLRRRPPEWCAEMSRRARRAAVADYSEEGFLRNMKSAIRTIILHKSEGVSRT
jgi:glycosyltransferase involved in cell wall biosynthesis